MKAVLGHSFKPLVESEAYDIFVAEEEVIEGDADWEVDFVLANSPESV